MWNEPSLINRREMLLRSGGGAGLWALAGLFQDTGLLLPSAQAAAANPLAAKLVSTSLLVITLGTIVDQLEAGLQQNIWKQRDNGNACLATG